MQGCCIHGILKDADASSNCVIGHGVNSSIAVGCNGFYVISNFFLTISSKNSPILLGGWDELQKRTFVLAMW